MVEGTLPDMTTSGSRDEFSLNEPWIPAAGVLGTGKQEGAECAEEKQALTEAQGGQETTTTTKTEEGVTFQGMHVVSTG